MPVGSLVDKRDVQQPKAASKVGPPPRRRLGPRRLEQRRTPPAVGVPEQGVLEALCLPRELRSRVPRKQVGVASLRGESAPRLKPAAQRPSRALAPWVADVGCSVDDVGARLELQLELSRDGLCVLLVAREPRISSMVPMADIQEKNIHRAHELQPAHAAEVPQLVLQLAVSHHLVHDSAMPQTDAAHAARATALAVHACGAAVHARALLHAETLQVEQLLRTRISAEQPHQAVEMLRGERVAHEEESALAEPL
mmetsp:Transcript_14231/g.41659  ORF Transcript_14231/g.41659 Transcript_14231/m.41659 type:complete len:254 (+) Transcript_14231:300-1061(+)